MPSWLVCRAKAAITALCAALAFVLIALCPARADDLSDFNAAIEDFASHNRVAIGYLRTGNNELAAVELGRMKTAWNKVMVMYGVTPPAALKGNPRFTPTMVGIQKNIADALVLINTGKTGDGMFGPQRADLVRNSLQLIREQLSAMRRASKITVLADCILEANSAMTVMFAFEYTVPDFNKPDLGEKANALGAVVKRCDEIADEKTKANPEFRRLIDGTLNSLTFIPKVIANKDREMLTRVIGELRAFDNLLLFRFG